MAKKRSKATDINMADLLNSLSGKDDTHIQILTQDDVTPVRTFISTGDPILDMKMGGGCPVGKFMEIYGEESTSKSTVAMHIVNNAINKHNGYALVLDVENEAWCFPERSLQLGLEPDKLNRIVYATPILAEDVFDKIDKYITNLIIKQGVRDEPVVIVWDSIAASTTNDEVKKAYGETGYLHQSRIIAQGHRKLTGLLNKNRITNVLFVWINQAREKLNSAMPFAGKQYTTFGGKAPAFFSTVRLELRHKGIVKVSKGGTQRPVGIQVLVTTAKNKYFSPKQKTTFQVLFHMGIDSIGGVWLWLNDESTLLKSNAAGGTKYKLLLLSGSTLEFSSLAEFRKICADESILSEIIETCQSHYFGMMKEIESLAIANEKSSKRTGSKKASISEKDEDDSDDDEVDDSDEDAENDRIAAAQKLLDELE